MSEPLGRRAYDNSPDLERRVTVLERLVERMSDMQSAQGAMGAKIEGRIETLAATTTLEIAAVRGSVESMRTWLMTFTGAVCVAVVAAVIKFVFMP